MYVRLYVGREGGREGGSEGWRWDEVSGHSGSNNNVLPKIR